MAVSTCLTSISRKVPPSELPAAVTGISFLSAYLFALMYASAPEKFLHPSDNSSPVSSLKRITVACQSGSLTPLPLVILAAAYRRFDNLFIKVHFYEQTVNDEYFLFFFQLSTSYHIEYIKSTSIFLFFTKRQTKTGKNPRKRSRNTGVEFVQESVLLRIFYALNSFSFL